MISTADFRKGAIIEWQGQPYEIQWFQNHKMAAEEAVMRVKIRNLYTGSIVERTFKNGERFKDIQATKRKTQFLYAEGDTFHFMDMQSYEQIAYPKDKLGDSSPYLKDNMEVEALYLDDKFLSISLPTTVELKVSSTVPGVKGDSVSNMMKPATLETGIDVQVPLFVKEGDTIRVDTRTGEYLSGSNPDVVTSNMLEEKLKQLVEFAKNTDLQELVWEKDGAKVSFRRTEGKALTFRSKKADAAEVEFEVEEIPPVMHIRSTMVGTFFRGDTDGRPPLVVEGTMVASGQPVGSIEAMKIRKDVVSPLGCRIVRSLVADGHAVEYGQPLFEVEPEDESN